MHALHLAGTLLFAGAAALSIGTIAASILPQRARIVGLLAGRIS